MAEWFSNLAKSALALADELTDSLVSQANEAQAQLIHEKQKLELEEAKRKQTFQDHRLLPWETDIESRQILSRDLMEKILNLSLHEENFLITAANSSEVEFYFPDFVPVAMQLLQLDSNLARSHAKLMPKMAEELFWFNYYCRIVYLRARSGIDGPDALHNSSKWRESEVIMESVIPPVPAPAVNNNNSLIDASESPHVKANTVNKSTPPNTKPSGQQKASLINPSPAQPKDSGKNDVTPTKDSGGDDDINLNDSDLDINDLDDDINDLDDLDISPEDFEKIGVEDGNDADDDELEAQIAQELADSEL